MTKFTTYLNDDTIIKRLQWFLIILFTVLIAWDFLLALDEIDDNTISRVIQSKTDRSLFILTYFWGAICANVFFPVNHTPKVNPTIGTGVMYAVAVIIWLVDANKAINTIMEVDLYKHTVGMALGFIIGLVFWRQRFIKPGVTS